MSPRLMVDLYESGSSIREIAEMIEMSKCGVRNRLLCYGVKLRKRGGNQKCPPHQEYAKTAFLYEHMGLSTNEIAEQLRLHPSTVQNRLKVHGVKMRTNAESVRLRWARRPKKRTSSRLEPVTA